MLMLKGDFSVPETPEGDALLEKIVEVVGPYLGDISIKSTVRRGVPYKLVYINLVEPCNAITNPEIIRRKMKK